MTGWMNWLTITVEIDGDGGDDADGDDDTAVVDPEVVCLCGSTKFKDEYRAENLRLTLAGKAVWSVAAFGHADGHDFSTDEKRLLDEVHKRKIDMSDRVHVIDAEIDGEPYIGESTASEIAYAEEKGRRVTYYSEQDRCRGDRR